MNQTARFNEILCAIVRGERVSWPTSVEPEDQACFLAACEAHGVAPLVYQQLHQTPTWGDWPANIRDALAHLSRVETVVDLLREQEVVRVLHASATQGVQLLLMKGTPLAYTHYASPCLRPRCDTDLLIQPNAIATMQQALTELGYTRLNGVSGKFIAHQCAYVKEDRYGVRHAYDVHWKISNSPPFSDLLSFEELVHQALPVPALGDHAYALAPVQALLLACLHRVAHHHNSERLIWLYDIHLLVSRMTFEERTAFIRLAADRRLQAVCGRGLQLAQHCFATPLAENFIAALYPPDGLAAEEATAHFLKPNPRRLHILLAELQTLSGWKNKIRLLMEHLLPPPAYLLNRYATTNRALLPVLYFHRVLRGVRKLWRHAL